VQEAAIARSLVVQLGHLQLPWDDFALIVVKFISGRDARTALTSPLEVSHTASSRKLYDESTQKTLSRVDMFSQLRTRVQNTNYSLAPSKLVYMCAERDASLRSDKVYALSGLFGLKSSSTIAPFPINYKLPATEVYKAFTVWCIQHESTLDIIAQKRNEGGASKDSIANLPS